MYVFSEMRHENKVWEVEIILKEEKSTTSDMWMMYHSNGRKQRVTKELLDEGGC